MQELLDDPERLALKIMELRQYARTKQQIDDAKKPEDAPHGPMADLVMDITAELMEEDK